MSASMKRYVVAKARLLALILEPPMRVGYSAAGTRCRWTDAKPIEWARQDFENAKADLAWIGPA